MSFNEENAFIIRLTKILFLVLVVLSFWASAYLFFIFRTESHLVFVQRENMEIRANSGKSVRNYRKIYLRNVYDAKSDTILYGDTIKVWNYNWDSKVSINRAIFFDNEKIRKADTLYLYLYKNDDYSFLPIIGELKLAWSPKIFGLSANKPPSKMYLITDMLGTAIQIGIAFCMVFTFALHFVEEKYFKDRDKLKYWHLIIIWILLFVVFN